MMLFHIEIAESIFAVGAYLMLPHTSCDHSIQRGSVVDDVRCKGNERTTSVENVKQRGNGIIRSTH